MRVQFFHDCCFNKALRSDVAHSDAPFWSCVSFTTLRQALLQQFAEQLSYRRHDRWWPSIVVMKLPDQSNSKPPPISAEIMTTACSTNCCIGSGSR
jgi:hypothetical protein